MKSHIKENAVWLSLLLVLAVMITIFCFSAQDGKQTSKTSGKDVSLIISLYFKDYDQLETSKQMQLHKSITYYVRKAAHFIEFAALGFTLMLHILTIRSRTRVPAPRLLAILIGVLYAASDELHQIFVPGRTSSLKDVLLDAFGVLFGVFLMWLIWKLRTKRVRKDAV